MGLYGSRKNVSAGLCVYMGADIMYQQSYVFIWEQKKCISRTVCLYGRGYNVSVVLWVYMGAEKMYQQDCVFIWERI
jgi:hypothetical protein